MNRHLSLLLLLVLLTGCASPPPPPPPAALQEAERGMLVGNDAFLRDDYATAALQFHQALAAYASLDQPRGIISARINLAQTALATGNLHAAREQLDAAQYTLSREGLAGLQPRLQLLGAAIAIRGGTPETAERLLEAILELPPAAPCKDPIHLAALSDRTGIAVEQGAGQASGWVDRFAGVLAGCPGGTDGQVDREQELLQGRLQRYRATLATRAGEIPAALQAYAEALHHYRRALYRPGLAATLAEWGALLTTQGEWEAARDRLQRALTIRLRLQDRKGTREVIEGLVRVEEQLGNMAQAAELREWLQRLGQEGFDDWPRLKERHSVITLPYR